MMRIAQKIQIMLVIEMKTIEEIQERRAVLEQLYKDELKKGRFSDKSKLDRIDAGINTLFWVLDDEENDYENC